MTCSQYCPWHHVNPAGIYSNLTWRVTLDSIWHFGDVYNQFLGISTFSAVKKVWKVGSKDAKLRLRASEVWESKWNSASGNFKNIFQRAQCKIQSPLCRTFQCNFRQDLQILTITRRNIQMFSTSKDFLEFLPQIIFKHVFEYLLETILEDIF